MANGTLNARARLRRRNVEKTAGEDHNRNSFPCPLSHLLMVEFSHSNDVQNSLLFGGTELNCHSIELKHLLLRQSK